MSETPNADGEWPVQDVHGTHSPFQDFFGYRVESAKRHHAVLRVPNRPEFGNRIGRIHGGVLMVIIDSVGGYSGCADDDGNLSRRCVTLSVTTNFLAAAKGDFLRAEATVVGGGKSIFFSSIKVFDEFATLVATGEGTYKYLRNRSSSGE